MDQDHDCIECDGCGAPGPAKRCARCHCSYYCSAECQKKDWKSGHKQACCPIEVMRDGLQGTQTLPIDNQEVHVVPGNNTSCGICFEEPMKQPTVLPNCQHTFCFTCLKDWQGYSEFDTSCSEKSKSPNFMIRSTCPLCRQEMDESLVIGTLETAAAYAARAIRLDLDDPKRPRLLEMAVKEINKVLETEPDDLLTLVIRSTIYLHIDPLECIRQCKRLQELDCKGLENQKKIDAMMTKVNAAKAAGNHSEARRLMDNVEAAYVNKDTRPMYIGEGPHRLFKLRILLSKAYEAVGKHKEALAHFSDMLEKSTGDVRYGMVMPDVEQLCELSCGVSRCYYQLGKYKKAYDVASMAMRMNRQFPGIHKVIAMAQYAAGTPRSKADAIRTMRRSILHEAPWDDANRRFNQIYLQELLVGGPESKSKTQIKGK